MRGLIALAFAASTMAAFSQASEVTFVGLTHKLADFDSTTKDIGGRQGSSGELARKEASNAFQESNGPDRKLPDTPGWKQRARQAGTRLVNKIQYRVDKHNAKGKRPSSRRG
ncbi:hypothetical protein AeNC1_013107 [Aphanomyces euteiches]|nr:hypothetical protein AeRB84_018331 [Aphanomyces euteiches]KAH9184916.1 hypothetical protein AeNC1_013107 [Aphanomyces euteiches]